MKTYTVIKPNGERFQYPAWLWHSAWWLVYLFGVIAGIASGHTIWGQ